MKIVIDIGHPGHVHYFKNVIWILKSKGHEILIMARDREFIFDLLKKYELPYVNRGEGSNSFIGKFSYMLKGNYKIYKAAKKFNPDLFLSFSSPYAAQVSSFMGKPHIALNDTEHEDRLYSIFTYPFSSVILTPESFLSSLGKKQIRFDNLIEGLYLQNKYFRPSKNIYNDLGIDKDMPFVLFRFVSWNAHHDFGQSGLDLKTKLALIDKLKNNFKIFISSEKELPEDLIKYKLPTSPEKIHDVIYYAKLFIGESSTMASESALLGTPAVFINSLPLMCNIKIGQDIGLIKQFKSNKGVIEYVEELIKNPELKKEAQIKSNEMQKGFINATDFLVWFVENFPESKDIMTKNPSFQYKFK